MNDDDISGIIGNVLEDEKSNEANKISTEKEKKKKIVYYSSG